MYGFRSNAKNDIGPSDVHLRGFLCGKLKAEGVKPKAEGSKLKVEEKGKDKVKGEEREKQGQCLGLYIVMPFKMLFAF